jgi:methionyl aminopeptidase
VARIPLITGRDADAAAAAAACVVQTHRRVAEFLRAGQTLAQVDAFVARTLEDLKCRSCFIGYRQGMGPAFPSHACLSVNECIVHGTASYTQEPLKPGDLLSVDIGVWHHGWIGDAAWTYAIAERSELAQRLMRAGLDSIAAGVQELRPGRALRHWAETVQRIVEQEAGFHLTRGLGGHGIGRSLHLPPFVSNVHPSEDPWHEAELELQPGMLLAVEPMITVGTGRKLERVRGWWPVFSADGSLSVHYEHDVLVTEDGPRVLTEGLVALPEIVG